MSWEAVKWATTQVPPGLVKLPARMVLTVFAEAADKHGKKSFQSHLTVAWRLGCTERNVTDHIKTLVDAGLLIVSADQSAVANLPADTRPVVYELPLKWVRTDTLEQARDEKRRKLGERRDRRKRKDVVPSDSGERSEESRVHGPKNPSATVRSIAQPRSEEFFHHGPNCTSDKPSLEPTKEPPLETHSSLAVANQTGDIEALCARLHAGLLANWNGFGQRPEVTDSWRTCIQWLLTDKGRSPDEIAAVIDYSQTSWWKGRVKSITKLAEHYGTMLGQLDAADTKPAATPTSKQARAIDNWELKAQQLDSLANTAGLLTQLDPLLAVEGPTAAVIDLAAYEIHTTEEAA
ncbi:hypothetical protein [Nocardia africana]